MFASLVSCVLAASAPDVTLHITGKSGGVSGHFTRMLAPELMTGFQVVHTGFSALEHHGCYVVTTGDDEDLALLRRKLASVRTRRVVGTQQAAQSMQDLTVDEHGGRIVAELLQHAAESPGMDAFSTENVVVTEWVTPLGPMRGIETPRCTRDAASDMDVFRWEVRSVTVMTRGNERLVSIARPMGEGSRRHARLMQEHGIEILAGSDIEGPSYLQGSSNLQRPVTLRALKQRRPAVWVPQHEELLEGTDGFLSMARDVGAVPVSANLKHPGVHPYAWLHGKRILLVGVTAQSTVRKVPAAVARTLKIEPPAPSVKQAIAQAVSSEKRWPDLILVVGVADAADVSELSQLEGVDVSMVRYDHSAEEMHRDFTVPARRTRALQPPIVAPALSEWRSSSLDIWFGPSGPARIAFHDVPITVDDPRDEAMSRAIQQVRQPIYDDGAKRILSAPLDEPRWTVARFNQLTSALVQDATGADVAITPPPREFWRVSGGFTRLRLQAALSGDDELVSIIVPGPELQRAVTSASAMGLGVAGMKGDEVGGRTVDPKERYLVVTTESLALQLGLPARSANARFVRRGGVFIATPFGGERVFYRAVILDGLEAMRAADPSFGAAYASSLRALMAPREKQQTSRFMLEARDLTTSLTLYDVEGEERYPQVPDNRVKTPRNMALLLNGLLRAAVETRYLSVESRLTMRWDRRVFNDRQVLDAANTWVATVEVREPFIGFSVERLKLRTEPYTSASFESQFFPLEPFTAPPWPRPKLAFGRTSVGAAVFGQVILKELRIGVVAQQDFTQPFWSDKTVWRTPGLSVGVETSGLAAYEAGPLALELTHAWRWLAPRPGVDTARDLAITALTRAALKARVFDAFSASLFADSYVFMGKLPGDMPGASFTVGVGLAVDRKWKPLREGLNLDTLPFQ